jgi:ribonuclease PH
MKMEDLGPRTIQIDCDVLQADGGTRVASITGSYIAFRMALKDMVENRVLKQIPHTDYVAAVSVGRVAGEILLDLNYPEDVKAEVDANIVMNSKGEFIEVQGTAEKGSFKRSELDQLMDSASGGCRQLFEIQERYVKEWGL